MRYSTFVAVLLSGLVTLAAGQENNLREKNDRLARRAYLRGDITKPEKIALYGGNALLLRYYVRNPSRVPGEGLQPDTYVVGVELVPTDDTAANLLQNTGT